MAGANDSEMLFADVQKFFSANAEQACEQLRAIYVEGNVPRYFTMNHEENIVQQLSANIATVAQESFRQMIDQMSQNEVNADIADWPKPISDAVQLALEGASDDWRQR